MTDQQSTGIGIIVVILLILWWLSKNALGFLHGLQTTVVQSSVVGGAPNEPTVTTYPDTGSCCS